MARKIVGMKYETLVSLLEALERGGLGRFDEGLEVFDNGQIRLLSDSTHWVELDPPAADGAIPARHMGAGASAPVQLARFTIRVENRQARLYAA